MQRLAFPDQENWGTRLFRTRFLTQVLTLTFLNTENIDLIKDDCQLGVTYNYSNYITHTASLHLYHPLCSSLQGSVEGGGGVEEAGGGQQHHEEEV